VLEHVAATAAPEPVAASVARATPAAPTGLPRAFPRLRGNEADPALRSGFAALQRAVSERMIARDQDPGPPDPPDVWGLQCGIKDGKFTCTANTPKGDVDVDRDTFSPDDKKSAADPDRPKNCEPERWNWVWKTCCAPGKQFDARQRSCVAVAKPKEIDFGPLPDDLPKGDFNVPAGDTRVA
jgi:hypothetical protein